MHSDRMITQCSGCAKQLQLSLHGRRERRSGRSRDGGNRLCLELAHTLADGGGLLLRVAPREASLQRHLSPAPPELQAAVVALGAGLAKGEALVAGDHGVAGSCKEVAGLPAGTRGRQPRDLRACRVEAVQVPEANAAVVIAQRARHASHPAGGVASVKLAAPHRCAHLLEVVPARLLAPVDLQAPPSTAASASYADLPVKV
mmetsp:Transcript_90034/g.291376  ORF Transcript_90034/g.291376 Transcript_90034/m.291376 type:complete len:202 (+) Transcript_90034:1-606(+)